jgi:hypothetical protein
VSILVKSDGSAVWIAENLKESAKGQPFYEVHIVNKSGTQLLAAGSDIDPSSPALKSLKFSGSSNSWSRSHFKKFWGIPTSS